jgi:hypothetical protein
VVRQRFAFALATILVIAAAGLQAGMPTFGYQDDQGKAWVSYNSPGYLKERHGLPQELRQNISVVEVLAPKAAE